MIFNIVDTWDLAPCCLEAQQKLRHAASAFEPLDGPAPADVPGVGATSGRGRGRGRGGRGRGRGRGKAENPENESEQEQPEVTANDDSDLEAEDQELKQELSGEDDGERQSQETREKAKKRKAPEPQVSETGEAGERSPATPTGKSKAGPVTPTRKPKQKPRRKTPKLQRAMKASKTDVLCMQLCWDFYGFLTFSCMPLRSKIKLRKKQNQFWKTTMRQETGSMPCMCHQHQPSLPKVVKAFREEAAKLADDRFTIPKDLSKIKWLSKI